jgi:hypothetical protein
MADTGLPLAAIFLDSRLSDIKQITRLRSKEASNINWAARGLEWLPRSATPMSPTEQTGPELGFSLIASPGRRDVARPEGRPQQLLRRGSGEMTDLSRDNAQDSRILLRLVSACTLGLWAFALGLLIGVFVF